jgi:hypothetical protein
MANMVASQKIGRTAFNLLIVLFLFLRASVRDFPLHTDRTAADAPRSNPSDIAQEISRKASRIFCGTSDFHEKK